MKAISSLYDLQPYGIIPLTGEACGLGLRLLCDLTGSGQQLIRMAYGLPGETQFSPSWNSGLSTDRHVGSILLDPSDYLFLGIFALLQHGYKVVYQFYPRTDPVLANRRLRSALSQAIEPLSENRVIRTSVCEAAKEALATSVSDTTIISEHAVYGVKDVDEDRLAEYLEAVRRDGWTFRTYRYRGTAGDRNVHKMSGRID